jgi:NAD(P)-dependent dehydrogenase (short-subunit alcohol dehydrogenase family)
MLLQDKVAVIYGAGGAVGGAVARQFAKEGATVFLAGRTPATLQAVAADIEAAGGKAEVAPVDALDPEAVRAHADRIAARAGGIDIAFNCIGLGDAQGEPLVEMNLKKFTDAIAIAAKSHFLTGTVALRHMGKRRAGVIMAIVAQVTRRPYANAGSFGVACAVIEAVCRQLAVEGGPNGVRVVCLRSAGSPDAAGVREAMSIHARNAGITIDELEKQIAATSMLGRMPRLAEVANAAALMASDRASAITGAVANVTCGEVVDV